MSYHTKSKIEKREPGKALNDLSNIVIGAAIEVHRVLGPGFLESVYEQTMCVELQMRGITVKRQVAIGVQYKDHLVGEGRLDLLVENKLVVELKAVDLMLPLHEAQLLSYLKATGHHLGLLINFNVSVLKDGIKRMVRS
ncbi:MAG: GxxExxY protein [Planctomycetota bacterium]|jgi:GxxExxY protein